MIDYGRCLGASVMLVVTLQAVAAIQPPLIAARSIASSGIATTNFATGGTAPQLTVFGVPQKTGSTATSVEAGRLDGSLTDVAQRTRAFPVPTRSVICTRSIPRPISVYRPHSRRRRF